MESADWSMSSPKVQETYLSPNGKPVKFIVASSSGRQFISADGVTDQLLLWDTSTSQGPVSVLKVQASPIISVASHSQDSLQPFGNSPCCGGRKQPFRCESL